MLYCLVSYEKILPLHLYCDKDDNEMKTRIILGIFLLLALCVRANDGNEYLTIPNRFGDKALLSDFRDYKDESDSITIEKVFFHRESNDSFSLLVILLEVRAL